MDLSNALILPEDSAMESASDKAGQQRSVAAGAVDESDSEPRSGHANSEQAATGEGPEPRQQKRHRHVSPGPPARRRRCSGKMRSLGEFAASGPSSVQIASAAASPQPQQQQQQQQQHAATVDAGNARGAAQQPADRPLSNMQQLEQHLTDARQAGRLTAAQPRAKQRLSGGCQGSRKKVLALPPPDGRLVADLGWTDVQALVRDNHNR
jgi:hypothetical protein